MPSTSRRRSSPSSVVAVVGRSPSSVISTFSSKGGTFEKNQIFAVFQKLAIFLKSKIFSKMSGRDFFAVDSHRRSSPSSVVAVVGRSPSSVSYPFSSKGGTFEKNQIFAVFQKLTIFLKSKIFSKMSGRDFIAVDGRRRSSPSSVISTFSSKGETFEKNQIFAVFQKNSQFF